MNEKQVFDKLEFLRKSDRSNPKRTYWECQCECGNIGIYRADHVKSGHTRSCGCIGTTHKDSNSQEFKTWASMIQRCYATYSTEYKRYGARGIKICDHWRDSYVNFLEDMGRKPSKLHSIERIDNNKDYSPDNCKWATKREQAQNRRTNRYIIWDGQKLCLQEFCRRANIPVWKLEKLMYEDKYEPQQAAEILLYRAKI